LTTIKHKRENLRDQKSDHERAIGKYKNKYEDKNKLLLEFAEKSLKFNEIQEKIDKLTPLPEEIIDLDKLVEEFEKVKVELDDSETLMRDCKLQIANLEGQAPEMSVEELGSQLSDANENFMRMLRKGKAIYKIKELTEELTKQLDGDTHIGLKKELEYYVSEITGKRYNKIAFSESLPDGFVREDGKTVPYELLSTGTKDVLSLSLRLSMASYFIKEANGFIVMDDPLVDLDPERQKNASKVLQTFACDKQVIVLTCHPTNAKLLGGNLINL